jgi:hypothetical protein
MNCYGQDIKAAATDRTDWIADKSGKNRKKGWIRVEPADVDIAVRGHGR